MLLRCKHSCRCGDAGRIPCGRKSTGVKSRQMANGHQGRVSRKQQVCWQRRQMQHPSGAGLAAGSRSQPHTEALLQRTVGQEHSSGGCRILGSGRWQTQGTRMYPSLELRFKTRFYSQGSDQQGRKSTRLTSIQATESWPSIQFHLPWTRIGLRVENGIKLPGRDQAAQLSSLRQVSPSGGYWLPPR